MSNDRLQHDFQAFLAGMRMSRHSLFIFVEGDLDYYVFRKICENELINNGKEYEVVMSSCFNGDGGKQVIINYFDFMKSQKALIDKFEGKVTASLFFVDKDLDDFLKKVYKSSHIVYTENYEVENYLFKHGEICEGISALISKKTETIKEHLGEYDEWRKSCVEIWKDWLKMCFFAMTKMDGSICSYGSPSSRINDDISGPVNGAKYQRHLKELELRSGLSPKEFKQLYSKASRTIDKLCSNGCHDLVFKGKWYIKFLEKLVRDKLNSGKTISKFDEKLIIALKLNLNLGDIWTTKYRKALQKVASKAFA